MKKKCSTNIITLKSQNLSLVIEDELYSRLLKLARFAEIDLTDYVEETIKKVTLPEQYCSFPDETKIIIKLYIFCLHERINYARVLTNLRSS